MISVISLLLDNIFNNSLFTLVSLIYLKKDNYYLLKCALLGLIYDLFFTDIIILHFTLFLLLGLFIKFLDKYINNKIIKTIIIITIYQILLFILFNILRYKYISINEFIHIFKNYYLINILYSIILSIIYKIKSYY